MSAYLVVMMVAAPAVLIWFFSFSPRAEHKREVYRSTLLQVIREQQPNGRGFTLQCEMEHRLGGLQSFGHLYVVLDKFEREGIVSSRWGQADPKHGRRPRLYWITADFPDLAHDGAR